MHGTRLQATREVLMVALQNVERILVRATGKHLSIICTYGRGIDNQLMLVIQI